MKPGYKETEFYLTIASMILGVLITRGVLSQPQADALYQGAQLMVSGLLMVAPTLAYIFHRHEIKLQFMKLSQITTTIKPVDKTPKETITTAPVATLPIATSNPTPNAEAGTEVVT